MMDQSPSLPLCDRCKIEPSISKLREQLLCCSCWDKYVRSKCIKNMESYGLRTTVGEAPEIPTLLLPISFGVCSTALLNFLDTQLKTKRGARNRTRYELLILHVDETVLDLATPSREHLDAVKDSFPEAGAYRAVGLEDIYGFGNAAKEVVDEIKVANGSAEDMESSISPNSDKLRKLLSSLPTTTSRMDIARILRTRLIVEVAKKEGCKGILWGDTTTRLAEKTLAETAKGRGFSLPWQLSDGATPYGVNFYYPLRDLFKKELVTYVLTVLQPSILPLCIGYSDQPRYSMAAATSARNITVDDLLTQYFENMEVQYPGIVSNVVRTAARLESVEEGASLCRICGLPADGGGGLLTLGALDDGHEKSGNGKGQLCYACSRSTHDAGELNWPLGR